MPFTGSMDLWLAVICTLFIVIKKMSLMALDSPFAQLFWLVISFWWGYAKSRGFQTHSAELHDPKLRIYEETYVRSPVMPS
jgi:hypothetical protein